MKYKTKFEAKVASTLNSGDYIYPGDTISDENKGEGVFIFVKFTDTNFFEPVKTRKFEVEVSEEHMDRFVSLVDDGLEPWTVTEITNSSWIKNYRSSGSYNAHLFSVEELSTIDIYNFKDNYQYGNKLQGVKWIKDQFGKGLKESKELADFIFDL